MLKIYCDTNVFLDFLNNRSDHLRPLGLFAFEFFSRGWGCSFHLVVSEWNIEELRNYASEDSINELLGYFEEKQKLIRVGYTAQEKTAAMAQSSHWQDALHLIIATREKCDKLVTRNVSDFPSSSTIDICYPENV